MGLETLTTPVRSPQSSGMAEMLLFGERSAASADTVARAIEALRSLPALEPHIADAINGCRLAWWPRCRRMASGRWRI